MQNGNEFKQAATAAKPPINPSVQQPNGDNKNNTEHVKYIIPLPTGSIVVKWIDTIVTGRVLARVENDYASIVAIQCQEPIQTNFGAGPTIPGHNLALIQWKTNPVVHETHPIFPTESRRRGLFDTISALEDKTVLEYVQKLLTMYKTPTRFASYTRPWKAL